MGSWTLLSIHRAERDGQEDILDVIMMCTLSLLTTLLWPRAHLILSFIISLVP